jgi:hypothetical protein
MATLKEIQKTLQKQIDTLSKCPLLEGELTITMSLTCKHDSWKEVAEGEKILASELKMPEGWRIYDNNAASNGRIEIRFSLTRDYQIK